MSESPILEPQAVANLRSINPDGAGSFVRQLVDIFLADTPKRIAEIQLALARNNATDLGRAAHTIKGSAVNFGATGLVALCFELEQLSKANALDVARRKLSDLEAEFERTRPALEALKAGV